LLFPKYWNRFRVPSRCKIHLEIALRLGLGKEGIQERLRTLQDDPGRRMPSQLGRGPKIDPKSIKRRSWAVQSPRNPPGPPKTPKWFPNPSEIDFKIDAKFLQYRREIGMQTLLEIDVLPWVLAQALPYVRLLKSMDSRAWSQAPGARSHVFQCVSSEDWSLSPSKISPKPRPRARIRFQSQDKSPEPG